MSQLTYNTFMPAGLAGLIYDAQMNDVRDSVVSAEATAAIPFGTLVVKKATGSTERVIAAVLPATNATLPLLGFVIFSHEYGYKDLDAVGLLPKTGLAVMRRGRIWVIAENGSAHGDPVHVRYAGTGQKGGTRNATVAAETFKLNNAVYLTASTAGGLAVIEFDLLAGATAGA